MSGRARSRALLPALLALAALALALHARLLRGEALLGADLLRLSPPWRAEGPVWNPLALDPLRQLYPQSLAFQAGGGASWDPQLFLGHAVGPGSFGSVVPYDEYPPWGLLLRVLPPWLGLGLFSLLHTFLSGAAALLWLRWRGCGARAALAGAIAWELSPLATVWLELPGFHAALAPWAILCVWAAEALGRAPGPRPALGLAGASGAAILAGDPVQVLLLLLSLPVWTVAAAPRGRRLAAIGWLAGALVLGSALGAARGLPLVWIWRAGHRGAPDSFAAHLASTLHLQPRHLTLLVCPDLLGSPLRGFNWVGTRGQDYANYQEARLYLGLPALILALCGLGRGRAALAPALLAGLGLGLAFPTPLARLAALTPLGATSPGRWLWWLHLAAPALVAAGLAGPARAASLRLRGPTLAVGAALLVVVAISSAAPLRAALLPPGVDPLQAELAARETGSRLAPWAAQVGVAAPWGRRAWLLSPSLGPLLLLAGWTVALALGRPRPRWSVALLAGLLAHDLLREGLTYNPSAPPVALFPATPELERLRALQGEGRTLLGAGLREDLLHPAGIRSVGGYGSLRSARTQALLGRWDPHPSRQNLSPRALPPAWRDALAVTCVACAPGQSPGAPAGLRAEEVGPALAVWSNQSALPRARLYPPDAVWTRPDAAGARGVWRADWFDPRRHVVVEEAGPARDGLAAPGAALPQRLLRDDPQRVEIEVTAPAGGLLLLADAWSPGWSVSLEPAGAAAPVAAAARPADALPAASLPADGALRAVRIPAGFQGRAVWTFALPGRAAGRALSGVSWALLGASWLLARRRTSLRA